MIAPAGGGFAPPDLSRRTQTRGFFLQNPILGRAVIDFDSGGFAPPEPPFFFRNLFLGRAVVNPAGGASPHPQPPFFRLPALPLPLPWPFKGPGGQSIPSQGRSI